MPQGMDSPIELKINRFQKTITWFKIIVSAIVLTWVINRLFILEITNDEAWSFHMVHKRLINAMGGTANNHWLNSIFIFLESEILGIEVWKIRLHSVFAFIVFIIYLFKITQKLPNSFLGFLTMLLLLSNTYTLDFFSLARGYGLGLAFGMVAIYHILFRYHDKYGRLKIYFILCLASFSVYTHLYFLLAFGLYELLIIYRFDILTKKDFLNYLKPLWLPACFLLVAIANLLFIRKTGDLREGQSNGFFQDTLGVFIQRTFEPYLSNNIATVLGFLLISAIVLCILLPNHFFVSTRSKKLAIILVMAFGIHEIFFYSLGVPFAFGRTSLYFMIPAILCLGIFFSELNYSRFGHYVYIGLLSLICVTQIAYMAFVKNINTTNEWWRGQGIGQLLNDIKDTEKRKVSDLSLLLFEGQNGVYRNYYSLLYPTLTFNKITRVYPENNPNVINSLNPSLASYDYILLPDYDTVLPDFIDFSHYDSTRYYPDMKTWLLKKR